MTKIDRDLQHRILTLLIEHYPNYIDVEADLDEDHSKLLFNLQYLYEHGLIDEVLTPTLDGFVIEPTKITNKGIDFLADDGGLSAILNVVTVKVEASQMALLLEILVMSSDLNPADKQSMTSALRELPAESIKHLTTKVVDAGWDSLPGLMILMQTLLFPPA